MTDNYTSWSVGLYLHAQPPHFTFLCELYADKTSSESPQLLPATFSLQCYTIPPPHEPKGFQTVMEEGSVNKTLCLQIITNVIPGLETNCLLLYMCAILDYGSCCPYQQKNGGRKSVKSSKNKQMTIRLVPPTW